MASRCSWWASTWRGTHALAGAAGWGAGITGALYALRLLGYALGRGAGVGMGDVKLGLGLGLAFGAWALFVVYVAFLFAALIVVAQRLRVGRDCAPARVALEPGFFAGACLYFVLAPSWAYLVTMLAVLFPFT